MANENISVRRGLLSMSQMGFVPSVNNCDELIGLASMVITRAMTTPKILYILPLDVWNAFGSLSHL
jgi:hypothetical protein